MPNRGGLGSRRRRGLRRKRARRQSRPSPYGPVVKIPVRYIGRFNITETKDVPGTFFSMHVPIGNKQLFASDYAAFNAFHEYKITSANIKVTWTIYKLKEWAINSNPEFVAATVCSFITDQESPAFDSAKLTSLYKVIPFDTVFSTLGSKVAHITTAMPRVTRHRWIPTEPQDRDWRKTDNDGLCHLYLCWQTDDMTSSKHAVTAIVEITTNLQLRELTIGYASTELSERDIFFYETYLQPRVEGASNADETEKSHCDDNASSNDWEIPSPLTEKPELSMPALELLSITQPPPSI